MLESLKPALADPFSGRAKDWLPPFNLPSLDDCATAIAHLEARLIGSTIEDVQICIAAMVSVPLAFEGDRSEASEDEWQRRTELYFASLKDCPPDLLEAGALRCIKACEFFPKPARWLKEIEDELALRKRMLNRAKLLDGYARNGKPREAFKREAEHVRLIALLRWYETPGALLFSARKALETRRRLVELSTAERQAAFHEGRDAEAWSADWLTIGIEEPPIEAPVVQSYPEPADPSANEPNGLAW